MSQTDPAPKTVGQKLLDMVERVGFSQRWQPDAGVGTVVAMMLPYAAATFIAWTILFFAWYLLGLPFGPG